MFNLQKYPQAPTISLNKKAGKNSGGTWFHRFE
jgi:hypothetical protein